MISLFFSLNINLLFPLILFGFFMGQIRLIAYRNFLQKKYGYIIIDIFNLIGTPVHEFGHLFFGLLFGCHIDKICLYRSLKHARSYNGTLGYVKMHHRQSSVWGHFQSNIGQFFIGIGPLISGPACILFYINLLPDNIKSLPGIFQVDIILFFQKLRQLSFTEVLLIFLLIYIMIGVSINMELSRKDLQSSLKGFFFLEFIFLLFSAVSCLCSIQPEPLIHILNQYIFGIAGIGLSCGLFANLISLI